MITNIGYTNSQITSNLWDLGDIVFNSDTKKLLVRDTSNFIEFLNSSSVVGVRVNGRVYERFEHFINLVTGTVYTYTSAGGAINYYSASNDAIGAVSISTGTTATADHRSVLNTNINFTYAGIGRIRKWMRVRFIALPNAIDTGEINLGFGNSSGIGDSNAIDFILRNDGNLMARARRNNVETIVDLLFRPSTFDWYDLHIDCNSAGNEVKYFVNGNLFATITTNIPNAVNTRFGEVYRVRKASATTYATIIAIDWERTLIEFNPSFIFNDYL